MSRDFRLLWAAAAISALGSQVTVLALPLVAALALGASPGQMGLLTAAELAPSAALALFAGVWIDRLRRRPIMIAADLGSAVLLATIPLVALLGALRIEQLYAVALLVGVCRLFGDVARSSFLPTLVPRASLVEANAKLATSDSIARVAGPGLGGALVQLLTAPIAIALDAASFLLSALCLSLMRVGEGGATPAAAASASVGDGAEAATVGGIGADQGAEGRDRARAGDGPGGGGGRARAEAAPTPPSRLRAELAAGLRFVAHHPLLRAHFGATALLNLFAGAITAVEIVYFTRVLGLAPALLGSILAAAGVAAVVGALLAPRVTAAFGLGPTLVASIWIFSLAHFPTALAGGPPEAVVAALVLGIGGIRLVLPLYGVGSSALLQGVTPDHLLGRVGASVRFVLSGPPLLGALVGGALGEALGARETLLLGATGNLLACLWLSLSPVRRLRAL